MIPTIISDLILLCISQLYPAFSTFKVVKSKQLKDYLKWIKYWIALAIYSTIEIFTGFTLSWMPFYNESKIAFVIWLLPPFGNGAEYIYKSLLKNMIRKHEEEIDSYIEKIVQYFSLDVFKTFIWNFFRRVKDRKNIDNTAFDHDFNDNLDAGADEPIDDEDESEAETRQATTRKSSRCRK